MPWDIVVGLVVLAFCLASFAWGPALLETRKPATLPPWTGRERESLQRDLELASVSFRSPVKTYRVEWYEDKRGHPKSSPVRLPYVPKQPPLEEVADTHGLFPEALDAYLESQE